MKADPNWVIAIAIHSAMKGDVALLERVDRELRERREQMAAVAARSREDAIIAEGNAILSRRMSHGGVAVMEGSQMTKDGGTVI